MRNPARAMPQWMVTPMLAGVLTPQEAAEIWQNYRQTELGKFRPLPLHLHQAAQRLHLWEVQPTAPMQ